MIARQRNFELDGLIIRLHDIARELEATDKMHHVTVREIRSIADRLARQNTTIEYTESELQLLEYLNVDLSGI